MTASNIMRAAILSFGLFMVWPAGAATYYVEETCDSNLKRITHPDYACTPNKDWPSKLEDAQR